MKKEKVLPLLIFTFIFLASVASGAFNYANGNFQRSYNGGDTIKGNLNISLTNEPSNSLFTSNFLGSISLIDFLARNNLSEVRDYNCSMKGCSASYLTTGLASTLGLSSDDKKVIGFRASGNNVQIRSLKFSLKSDAFPSCNSDLTLNIAGNSSKLFQNYKYINSTCGVMMRGCFNRNLEVYDLNPKLTSTPFCEKIVLPIAPAIQAGARIQNTSSGTSQIKMEMFGNVDSAWQPLGSCILPLHTSNVQDLNCTIAHPTKSEEYLICVSTDTASTDYRINAEQMNPVCGSYGVETEDYSTDYDIFAQALQFDSLNLTVNETTYGVSTGDSLTTELDEYIDRNYNRNCTSSNGCVIPFEINVKNSQTVSISDVKIEYDATNLPGNYNGNVYFVEKTNSTINFRYLNLDVEKAEFTIPVTTTQKNLQFYINGNGVLPSALPINVTQSFTFDLTPKSALVGIGTNFNILMSARIVSASWKFGDNTPTEVTTEKQITHKYNQAGNYSLEVEITDLNGTTVKKIFGISILGGAEAIQALISQKESKLNLTSTQIQAFDPWIRNELNKKVNITNKNIALQGIKSRYASAISDDAINEVINSLTSLEVPDSIEIVETGELPLDVGFVNIDSEYALTLSENNTDSLTNKQKDDLKQNIINWNSDNYESNVEYVIISASQDNEFTPLVTQFKIRANAKGNTQKVGNLVIDRPKDEIVFKENYNSRSVNVGISSAAAVPMLGSKTIEFLLPEKVDVSEIGAYIAPEISELSAGVEDPTLVTEPPIWKKAKWIYAGVVVLFIILYIILQEWYKRRYESHLFNNQDDLYNLINFIFNARVSRLGDEDIKAKLLGFRWTGEQLNYAFRKIDGKRTGMWEIPIFKFIENNKVKNEIQKRQEGAGDARFIKTQY